MISFQECAFPEPVPEGLLPARVTEVRRGVYGVVCPLGELSARGSGALLRQGEVPAVGDYALLRGAETGNPAIVRLLARRTKFSRADFSGHKAEYVKTVREQVVAANFDRVFVLSSLNRDFSVNRILRYLTLAHGSGADAAIVLTKADLCAAPEAYIAQLAGKVGGAPVLPVSAATGAGLSALAPLLPRGQTAVFLGMSGVGKSSLLNALAGEELMRVSDIRESDARGRHTTTHRQMFRLPTGAFVIDTPGMREIGLWDAEAGIGAAFSDVEEIAARCRFSDCSHRSEPGCAIRAAIEDGELPRERWDAYRAQKGEAAFMRRRMKKER